MNYISVNHEIVEIPGTPDPANRGLTHGAGLFETMKVRKGKIILEDLHFQRLFASVSLLKISFPFPATTSSHLANEVMLVCKLNGYENSARVRMTIGYRSEKKETCMAIECWPLEEDHSKSAETGLVVDTYPSARKQSDRFANLKTNYLPIYADAAKYAKDAGVDDCIVLNEDDSVADTSIANIFIVRSGTVITPPLEAGCVAGVMRRHLLEKLRNTSYMPEEKNISIDDLETADEMFLTNAIRGIRWVRKFGQVSYRNIIGSGITALLEEV